MTTLPKDIIKRIIVITLSRHHEMIPTLARLNKLAYDTVKPLIYTTLRKRLEVRDNEHNYKGMFPLETYLRNFDPTYSSSGYLRHITHPQIRLEIRIIGTDNTRTAGCWHSTVVYIYCGQTETLWGSVNDKYELDLVLESRDTLMLPVKYFPALKPIGARVLRILLSVIPELTGYFRKPAI